jgi:hypothetical protein
MLDREKNEKNIKKNMYKTYSKELKESILHENSD